MEKISMNNSETKLNSSDDPLISTQLIQNQMNKYAILIPEAAYIFNDISSLEWELLRYVNDTNSLGATIVHSNAHTVKRFMTPDQINNLTKEVKEYVMSDLHFATFQCVIDQFTTAKEFANILMPANAIECPMASEIEQKMKTLQIMIRENSQKMVNMNEPDDYKDAFLAVLEAAERLEECGLSYADSWVFALNECTGKLVSNFIENHVSETLADCAIEGLQQFEENIEFVRAYADLKNPELLNLVERSESKINIAKKMLETAVTAHKLSEKIRTELPIRLRQFLTRIKIETNI